jgi:DNA invertase Pin-like site-specific DNA recombinase
MSTTKQEDSPERQRSTVQPHCRQQGYHIVGEYLDPGISGDEFTKRTEFQRLLRDAAAGKFDGIVVDHKDRLSRADPVDYIATIVHPLRRAGVWVESVATRRVDWSSIGGGILDYIQQYQTSDESKERTRRSLNGIIKHVKAGE